MVARLTAQGRGNDRAEDGISESDQENDMESAA